MIGEIIEQAENSGAKETLDSLEQEIRKLIADRDAEIEECRQIITEADRKIKMAAKTRIPDPADEDEQNTFALVKEVEKYYRGRRKEYEKKLRSLKLTSYICKEEYDEILKCIQKAVNKEKAVCESLTQALADEIYANLRKKDEMLDRANQITCMLVADVCQGGGDDAFEDLKSSGPQNMPENGPETGANGLN